MAGPAGRGARLRNGCTARLRPCSRRRSSHRQGTGSENFEIEVKERWEIRAGTANVERFSCRFASIWAIPSQVRRLGTRWPDLVSGKNIGPVTIPRVRNHLSRTVRVSSTTCTDRTCLPLPFIVSTPSSGWKSTRSSSTSSDRRTPIPYSKPRMAASRTPAVVGSTWQVLNKVLSTHGTAPQGTPAWRARRSGETALMKDPAGQPSS